MGRNAMFGRLLIAGISAAVKSYKKSSERKRWRRECTRYGMPDIDEMPGADFEKFLRGL